MNKRSHDGVIDRSGNFKIGQNNEGQCENLFVGTLNADGEHTDFVGH